MPPDLECYGLTKRRDLQTINHFLDHYVDRVASEDRGEEELMIEPLSATATTSTSLSLEDYEWEPAKSLSHSIERGLDYPRRTFTIYLKSNQADITRVILSFTADDQLILGVSIDDEGAKPENLELAKSLLANLAQQYDCHLGLISVEQPPPQDEVAFRKEFKEPLTEFFCEFDTGS